MMRFLAPAILALSLLTFDATARSRVGVPPSDTAGPVVPHSIRTLNEVVIPPVSNDPEIHQTNPVIASDGESFLIVWRESTGCCFWIENQQTTGLLYIARLNSRGERVGEPILVSSTATTSTAGLTFDGTNYLLAWGELGPLGMRVVAQRFSPDLIPVELTPFIIRNPVPSPDMRIGLACGPDDCLVIFDQGHALISKTGGVFRFSLDTGGLRNAVISTGTGYLATMTVRNRLSVPQLPAPPTDENTIAGFSREGTVSGPFELGLVPAYAQERISASLATNGSSILVAAVDSALVHQNDDPRPPLYFTWASASLSSVQFQPRFSVDVGMFDGIQPTIRDPQVIWTGRRYLLVFQRSNESRTHNIAPTKADIWGVWIDSNGSGTSGPAFALTATDEFESLPAITVNGRGLTALAFVRGRGGEDSPNPRLFIRLLSDASRARPARRSATPPSPTATLTAEKKSENFVLLTLKNESAVKIGYNLCFSKLERKDGEEWTDITSREISCLGVLNSLQPGESASLTRWIFEDLSPGTYRFRTEAGYQGCVACEAVISNSLQLPSGVLSFSY